MKQIGVKNVKLSEYEMSIAAHLVDPLNMHVCIFNLINFFLVQHFVSRVPKITTGFDDSLGGITGFSVVITHGCNLLQQKDVRQNQQR